jgi:methane monooxygenase component C
VTIGHPVQLRFDGGGAIEIRCGEHEDIVTGALRQRVLLLSECREGTCGTCRARLESGSYDTLLEHSPHALSDREEEDGWVLACRLQPRGPLSLSFDYPADRAGRLDEGRTAAHVSALEPVSPSVMRLVVRTLAAAEPLRWEPGQYVRLRMGGVTRSYSMANLPGDARELEFYVRLLRGGRFSEALAAMPGAGAAATVEGPFGRFTLAPEAGEPVFVAGGTGLAPILSMLRALARRPSPAPATLIFGVTRPGDLFALSPLRELQGRWPGLRVFTTVADPSAGWQGERGTAVELLGRHLETFGALGRSYYLCGPPVMILAARDLLRGVGVLPDEIHDEPFVATEK